MHPHKKHAKRKQAQLKQAAKNAAPPAPPAYSSLLGYQLATVLLPEHAQVDAQHLMRRAGVQTYWHAPARSSRAGLKPRLMDKFLPTPEPKFHQYQTFLQEEQAERFFNVCMEVAHLHVSGAGSAYSTPFKLMQATDSFPLPSTTLHTRAPYASHAPKGPDHFIGIACIVEHGFADNLVGAALKAGVPGGTLTFAEGRGLRDKIRWMRWIKQAEKDVVVVIAERVDADVVMHELASSARITEPGRGILYSFPVSDALLNILHAPGNAQHAATMQEMIAAIDALNGSRAWRGHNPSARQAKLRAQRPARHLSNLTSVTCWAPSEAMADIEDCALHAGAPAVSSQRHMRTTLVPKSSASQEDERPKNIVEEIVALQAIVASEKATEISDALWQLQGTLQLPHFCVTRGEVMKAHTYLG